MKQPSTLFTVLVITLATIWIFMLPNQVQGQSAPAFVSDDFSASNLNPSLWTFVNPLGDATLTMTGAQARISVPAGASHDVWTNGNLAPRIKQPAKNTDFEIEVKFESPVRRMYQLQGVFVEQDGNNFLRFDFYSDGAAIKIFSAVLKNGSASVKGNQDISAGLSFYMRVTRKTNQWTQSYSYDGVNWAAGASFVENLSVTAVGAFVGNSGTFAPAHIGVIDYFFNTAFPINPEDRGRYTVTVNVTGDGTVVKQPDRPTYGAGEVVKLTAIPNSGLSFHGWSENLTGKENPVMLTLTSDYIIGATFTTNDKPVIDVWYGPQQTFGHLGIPQQWVNVLGKVSDYDGIASLTFALNGSPSLPISIGPGNPRLIAAGDFNVEISHSDLSEGQNQVAITATDRLGNITVRNVTIQFFRGRVWPERYSINWSTVNKIPEVAQIVDGKWKLGTNGVRPEESGYDRVIAIGDVAWRDYEVTVPITIHKFDFRFDGAIVGLLMRWDGHDNWGGEQPNEGWWPMGAIGAYEPHDANSNSGSLRIIGDRSVDLAKASNRRLELNVPYIFKMSVETTPGQGGLYKLKVWRSGDAEPSGWDLTAQEGSSDPANGSFLLVAHNTDASFGDVAVTPVIKVMSNIEVKRGDTWATISWNTSQPATSKVAYGESESYEKGSVEDNTLTTEHKITLRGLIPGTTYHYQITSVDRSGYVAKSPDLTFKTITLSTIVSDDFNSSALNTQLWKFMNPLGDAVLQMTGNQVAITIPAGTAHDVWTTGNLAPRIMQSVSDTDFEVEAKFVSALRNGFQIQGILVDDNSSNFLRFDFHHDGWSTKIFAAVFVNGSAIIKMNGHIAGGVPLYMRVKREEARWTQSYSYDGKNWTTGISFVHVLPVRSVGVFIGNAGNNAPAFTGLIDYFVNVASPLVSIADKVTIEAPAHFELHQNYPNPFNPQTTIEFSLPAPGLATLKVFTLRGEEIAVLVAEKLAAGPHKAVWNAGGFPSGVYFYRLSVAPSGQTAPVTLTKKLVLTK